ncbi:hypothetical protein Golob_010701, partial [Gossypium lobatum]|nr:hypothetical protein [Gossypium lobatum]
SRAVAEGECSTASYLHKKSAFSKSFATISYSAYDTAQSNTTISWLPQLLASYEHRTATWKVLFGELSWGSCPGTVGCCYVRDGKNVVPDVCNVLDKIMEFSEKVLSDSSWGASCFLKHLVEYAVPQLLICR